MITLKTARKKTYDAIPTRPFVESENILYRIQAVVDGVVVSNEPARGWSKVMEAFVAFNGRVTSTLERLYDNGEAMGTVCRLQEKGTACTNDYLLVRATNTEIAPSPESSRLEIWKTIALRLDCGCLTADCAKHGSWQGEHFDMLKVEREAYRVKENARLASINHPQRW